MTKTLNYEELSSQEIADRKQYMYDKMSKRRRKFVDRMGYDNWDPFAAPFDPIDIRKDMSGFTSDQLSQMFVHQSGKSANQEYIDAVNEFNVMLVMNFEKVRPVFEYCLWYAEHLKKRGITP